MPKKRSDKQQEVDALHRELLRVSTLVLTSFHGLKAGQETELRRLIENVGGKYRVVKNTLARRASQETPAAPL
ncbi:50S ribosomal protein L10, partial [Acidobacteriia bacterium AH_259_A11_L15]|nr:50S ribosomal protein L10 [Acidobacteriia bacterium AH_259_A11_L15]